MIIVGKWKTLGIIDEGLNNETRIRLHFLDFHGKNVAKLFICLSGLLRTRLSLKTLVVFIVIPFMIHVHPMLNRTMLLFRVKCVILLFIMLVGVLIMHIGLILIRLHL